MVSPECKTAEADVRLNIGNACFWNSKSKYVFIFWVSFVLLEKQLLKNKQKNNELKGEKKICCPQEKNSKWASILWEPLQWQCGTLEMEKIV